MLALFKEWYVVVLIGVWFALLTYGLYRARQQRRKVDEKWDKEK
jgi:hypothetical protein